MTYLCILRKWDRMNLGNSITCNICPHNCRIKPGNTGICGVRKNTGEEIELLTYGIISGIALDPVEKKPLYHFYPGKYILSIGSFGCNMRCDFCQNYHISQNTALDEGRRMSVDEIVREAINSPGNKGIAFTYNEPVIWYEFVMDVASGIIDAGLKTVMVTNGYATPESLNGFLKLIDAFNVDLKAFNGDFYKRYTGSDIDPVKNALKKIRKAEKHLEITTLIIPGLNDNTDDFKEQVKWISEELGKDVPLHLSRYYPMYRRNTPATSETTLRKIFEIASSTLDYVYLGNIISDEGSSTYCPNCRNTVTTRHRYGIIEMNAVDGKCRACGFPVFKYF